MQTNEMVNNYLQIYMDLFRKACREDKDIPDIMPTVLNGFASWNGQSPPQVETMVNLLYTLPPIIARKKVHDYFGGAISARTLTEHDYRGTGPRVKWNIGKNVCYPTPYLLEWLEKRHVRDVKKAC